MMYKILEEAICHNLEIEVALEEGLLIYLWEDEAEDDE